jgi:chemotaxis protein CheD
MTLEKSVHVQIGQVKLGKPPQVLKATLGSCVGIAILWKEKRKFALAHCLLAQAKTNSRVISAKYVSQAIPSLLALLKLREENYDEVEVYLAGGANMVDSYQNKTSFNIGEENSKLALKMINDLGLKVIKTDFGGKAGRQIIVNCQDATVDVRMFSKNEEQEKKYG